MAQHVLAGLLLVLLLPQEAAATSYYLSSAGDDSSPGTSPATPWRTLGRVGELKLRVGDELLLRKGDSWIVESGDALVLRGASGLVSSYGNSTDSQPLIQVSSCPSSACLAGPGLPVCQQLPLTHSHLRGASRSAAAAGGGPAFGCTTRRG
eukprot:COSAG04_NODE_2646_length_3808_cov_2.084120_3_plen_151_part_00